MNTFKKELYYKVLNEAIELDIKIKKLDKFIKSDTFLSISIYQQKKLKNQLSVMIKYLDILNDRLKDMGKKINE